MDNVLPMRVVKRRSGAATELERLLERHLAVAQQPVSKRLAFDNRHHVKEKSGGFARIEQWNDTWMVQACGELYLA